MACCTRQSPLWAAPAILPGATGWRCCVYTLARAAQLSLLSDDGLPVSRAVPAVIFSAPGPKGRYKLERDQGELRALASSDSEVLFVGSFKRDKSGRAAQPFSLGVSSFAAVASGSSDAASAAANGNERQGIEDDDSDPALAVYPAR